MAAHRHIVSSLAARQPSQLLPPRKRDGTIRRRQVSAVTPERDTSRQTAEASPGAASLRTVGGSGADRRTWSRAVRHLRRLSATRGAGSQPVSVYNLSGNPGRKLRGAPLVRGFVPVLSCAPQCGVNHSESSSTRSGGASVPSRDFSLPPGNTTGKRSLPCASWPSSSGPGDERAGAGSRPACGFPWMRSMTQSRSWSPPE